MSRFVALLRAVNLGPVNRIANHSLREWMADLGYGDVKTYLASGNVVFTADTDDRVEHATTIEQRIADETGLAIDVLVRSHRDIDAALRQNPYPDADPARLLITFLGGEPSADSVTKLTALRAEREGLAITGDVAYLHCLDGIGRSKLAARFAKTIDVVATARNLKTVRVLEDMTRS